MAAFLNRRQLAERWALKEATLASWACEGKGPTPSKFGKAVRYSLAEVEAFEKAAAQDKRSTKRKGR
jgi:phosphopantetheinyl transferase (holo-ACP synthase)